MYFSAEIFQALSVAHSILIDPSKREEYDKNGAMDEGECDRDYSYWYEYFRSLFPKLTVESIKSFSSTYIGSTEEKNDILREYTNHKGDFSKIMNSVMLAEVGDEERIEKVIDLLIAEGSIKSNKKYLSSLEKVKKTAQRKLSKRNKNEKDDNEALIVAIQKKRASSGSSAMSHILDKYGSSANDDISDTEFEALRAKITKKK